MKIHDLKPAEGAHRSRKRVGRGIGGKGGKTAGRGTKGQRARGTVPVSFEGGQLPLTQRVPKLRGFNNPFRVEYQAINLDGRGSIDRAVTVRVHACSKSAEAAITGAGGSVELLPLPFKVRPAFHGSAHTNR